MARPTSRHTWVDAASQELAKPAVPGSTRPRQRAGRKSRTGLLRKARRAASRLSQDQRRPPQVLEDVRSLTLLRARREPPRPGASNMRAVTRWRLRLASLCLDSAAVLPARSGGADRERTRQRQRQVGHRNPTSVRPPQLQPRLRRAPLPRERVDRAGSKLRRRPARRRPHAPLKGGKSLPADRDAAQPRRQQDELRVHQQRRWHRQRDVRVARLGRLDLHRSRLRELPWHRRVADRDPGTPKTAVASVNATFELAPNLWRLPPGHELELVGSTAPWFRASNGTFSISVSNVSARIARR